MRKLIMFSLLVSVVLAGISVAKENWARDADMMHLKYSQACETWRFFMDMRLKVIAIFFTLTSGLLLAYKWAHEKNAGQFIAIVAALMTVTFIGMEWRCRMMYRKANEYAEKLEAINDPAGFYTKLDEKGICTELRYGEWWKGLDTADQIKSNLFSGFNLVYLLIILGWFCLFFWRRSKEAGASTQ